MKDSKLLFYISEKDRIEGNSPVSVRVELACNGLEIGTIAQEDNVRNLIPWIEIINCDIIERDEHLMIADISDAASILKVICYQRRVNKAQKRKLFFLIVQNNEDFRQNEACARELQEDVHQLISKVKFQKPILIIVNPKAGYGNGYGEKAFQEHVEPVLQEASQKFELVVTSSPGQARELMSTFNHEQYSAVMIVSGDGLVFEVVNGLMERADWLSAIRTPLSIVPVGSGNALYGSILHDVQQPVMGQAARLAVTSTPRPMDIVSMETEDTNTPIVHSSLSLTWAMVSAVDMQSERLRSVFGSWRFSVTFFLKLCALRIPVYRARLSYLPVIDEDDHSTEVSLPPLSSPVPDEWVQEDIEVTVFSACWQPKLAMDTVVSPDSKLNDGIIHLFMVDGQATRINLVQVFLCFDKGTHKNHKNVRLLKTRAFRLEPKGDSSTRGVLAVDGEHIPCGNVQGRVLPGIARVMA